MVAATSPVHHASLVDPATHNPALLDLVDAKVSRAVIAHVVQSVSDVVDYAFSRSGPSSSQHTQPRGRSTRRDNTDFAKFASRVITTADVQMPVILGTLAYIERARRHLQIALEEWACERVFLGALIVASKYLNDSTLKNVHWAYCTGVFGKSDVGRIEREFLDVLAFELSITESELLPFQQGLLHAARVERRHHRRTTASPEPSEPEASPAPPRAATPGHELPELSSSPSSAASSSHGSPQTPATLVSPSFAHRLPGAPMDVDAPAPAIAEAVRAAAESKGASKKGTKGKRHSPLDLLRALPLPRPGHHHARAGAAPPRPAATWA